MADPLNPASVDVTIFGGGLWHGPIDGSTAPPMAARFRLKANVDISGFGPQSQVIMRAMKKYGMFLADNGSSW